MITSYEISDTKFQSSRKTKNFGIATAVLETSGGVTATYPIQPYSTEGAHPLDRVTEEGERLRTPLVQGKHKSMAQH